jgi:hypothetical protein
LKLPLTLTTEKANFIQLDEAFALKGWKTGENMWRTNRYLNKLACNLKETMRSIGLWAHFSVGLGRRGGGGGLET